VLKVRRGVVGGRSEVFVRLLDVRQSVRPVKVASSLLLLGLTQRLLSSMPDPDLLLLFETEPSGLLLRGVGGFGDVLLEVVEELDEIGVNEVSLGVAEDGRQSEEVDVG
jgi:hypothetical protein